MANLIHAIAAALLLAGCATAPPKEPPLPLTVTLSPAAALPLGAATLVYEGAVDSRCPKGVMCIWAGEISYQFAFKGPAGSESFSLTRAAPVRAMTTAPGLRVTLLAAQEPPVGPPGTPTPAIAVTVTVSRP